MYLRPDNAALAATIASALLRALCEGALVKGSRLGVSGIVGIALCPRDGRDTETLLQNADAAMYEARQNGRDTFRFFDTVVRANATRILQVQRDRQRARSKRTTCTWSTDRNTAARAIC